MPKSKGKRGKGKNKSFNNWHEDVPENIPIMDSSVSSGEDDYENQYQPTAHRPNDKKTPPNPTNDTTMNENIYDNVNDNQDGQDWPDDISDSHLLLIRETESGILEFQEPTLEQQIQNLLHTRVRIITFSGNTTLGNTITGKLTESGTDRLGDYVILRGVELEGKKVSFRIRHDNIGQIYEEEELGPISLDDDMTSVKSFQQRGTGSAKSSSTTSNRSSRRTTPEKENESDQKMTDSEEQSRPETALSGVLNLDKDEYIDQLEELMKTNQEQLDSSEETDDEEIDEEDDKRKAKTFISTIKTKLRGKLQAGEIAITDMMESVLTTCEQMDIHITKEKIKKMFIPHTMDFKKSRDLAALYRLIVVKTTNTPRRKWNFLKKHAFEDAALFEDAKLRWICSCKARINQYLEEQRKERQFQGKTLNTKEAIEHIWNTSTLVAIIKKSAKEHGIRFSDSQIEWAITEMKPPTRDTITMLQNLAWWEQVWMKLATHPMSKIPLSWNGIMRDIYPRDTYPARGYLRPPYTKTQDELTIASSSDQETDTKRSPPPDPETVRKAKNKIAENLAINGPMTRVTPDDINKELDWLAKSHANAKTFLDKLDDISRKRLAPIYSQWMIGFPVEPFKVVAYRQFPYLYDLGLDNEDSIANMERYKKPLSPPTTPKEWMQLFKEDCKQEEHTTLQEDIEKERTNIKGNFKHNLNLSQLNTIQPEDFQQGGRFAHIYIGRQCKIPPEILKALETGNPESSDQIHMIWRPLYAARLRAAESYKAKITATQRIQSPWLEILCDDSIPKDFDFDEIDKVQYAAAWQKYDFTRLQMTGPETLYNIFIRPLERMFAADMPMNQKLMEAIKSKDGTTDLTTYIVKLVGWDATPFTLDASRMVEELSKIRALRSRDFYRSHPMDMPSTTLRRQACKAYPDNIYDRDSINDRARRLGCEDEALFQNQSKENMDEILDSITKEIRGLMTQLENNTEELETIRYQQRHVKEPAGLRKLDEKKEIIQAETAKIRENLTRKWRDYRITSERRNILTYRPEKTTEQTRQELMNKTNLQLRNQLKHATEEWRTSFKNLKDLKDTYTATISSRFNFFSHHQADTITSMMSRIQTQERHLKELDAIKDAIIVAINKKEEDRKPTTTTTKHTREEENFPTSVKVPRINWLEMYDESSNSDIKYPDMSTPKDSSTDISMTSTKNPQKPLYPSLREMQTDKPSNLRATGAIPKQPQSPKPSTTHKPGQKPPTTPRKPIKLPPQNSWMESQQKREWPQTVNYWPQPGNKKQPEWTSQKGSINEIHSKIPFMTISDVLNTTETPRLVTFQANAGSYRNTITISINTFTTKKDQLEIPLGLKITQESTYMTGEGRPLGRKTMIPQPLIEGVETSLKVYENVKLNPLAAEMGKPYKEEHNINHTSKNSKVETAISTENEEKQRYRAIIIKHTKYATNETNLVRIPWIHLPPFNHYYEKMAQEVRMIIARYEARKGPRSFETVDPEQKLREELQMRH